MSSSPLIRCSRAPRRALCARYRRAPRGAGRACGRYELRQAATDRVAVRDLRAGSVQPMIGIISGARTDAASSGVRPTVSTAAPCRAPRSSRSAFSRWIVSAFASSDAGSGRVRHAANNGAPATSARDVTRPRRSESRAQSVSSPRFARAQACAHRAHSSAAFLRDNTEADRSQAACTVAGGKNTNADTTTSAGTSPSAPPRPAA